MKVTDLEIVFTPFPLKVSIGAKYKAATTRGSSVLLPEFEIEDLTGNKKLRVTHLLEYLCQPLDRLGMRLVFSTESFENAEHFRRISLSKRIGFDLTQGEHARMFEAKSYSGDAHCWHWKAAFKTKKKEAQGRTIKPLNALKVDKLKRLELDFGIAPPEKM